MDLLKFNNYFVTIIFDFLNLQRRNRIREVQDRDKVSRPDSLYIIVLVYYDCNTSFWVLVFENIGIGCICRCREVIDITIRVSSLMYSVCRLACSIVGSVR